MHFGLRDDAGSAAAKHGRNIQSLPFRIGASQDQRARNAEAGELARELAKGARSKQDASELSGTRRLFIRSVLPCGQRLKIVSRRFRLIGSWTRAYAEATLLVGRLAFRPTSS